ncbi:hypothetical protein HMPREF3206_01246 [Fusobacterium equinum]|uniref:Uncharacterized protein n=1 Tax=Fusobacterium equinum TaxID=134605 RepID=A0A133NBM9_9FUSO|nr:hypothetical protein HMPREF3206_01246 [Fusobacterium equinum]
MFFFIIPYSSSFVYRFLLTIQKNISKIYNYHWKLVWRKKR